jgi:uncharacterized integral membrane protein
MSDVEHGKEKQPKRSGREESRLAIVVVLSVLGTAFALENLDRVKVNYIFGTGHPRLIFIIVFCIAIGVGIGWFSSKRRAGRSKGD